MSIRRSSSNFAYRIVVSIIKGGDKVNIGGREYLTAKEVADQYSDLYARSTLQRYLFNREHNGLKDAVVKMKGGRKLWIDKELFEAWIKEQMGIDT